MSKLYTFEDIPAGVCWLVGIRALNGVANPSGMASLQYRLIDDGRSMFLSADNGKGGRAECIVTLPDRVTEDGAEASISSRWSGSAHGCGRRLQSGQHD